MLERFIGHYGMGHAIKSAPVACEVHELEHTAFSVSFFFVDRCSFISKGDSWSIKKIFLDFLRLRIFEDHDLFLSEQAHVDQPVDDHFDVSFYCGKTELIRALLTPGDLVVVIGDDHRSARELAENWH
jgi:hypothetical protein